MTGQFLGRGDRDGAQENIRYLVIIGTVINLTTVSVLALFLGPHLVGLYNEHPQTIALASGMLLLMLPFMPFWGLSFIMPQSLKGAGDTRYTLAVSVSSMWLIRIVLGWFLGVSLGMGLKGIWIGMCADWVVRGVFYWLRYRSGVWKTLKVIRTKPAMAAAEASVATHKDS